MTVLNGDGLVGRVKTVGPTTSTVLLAIDPDFIGRRAAGGDRGARASPPARAAGRAWTLQLLDGAGHRGRRATGWSPSARRGHAVRARRAGRRGAVACGGTPGSLTSRAATVEPFVDFTALDLVGVVVEPPRTDPRDAVLPPTPPAPPAPTVTGPRPARRRVTAAARPARPRSPSPGRGRWCSRWPSSPGCRCPARRPTSCCSSSSAWRSPCGPAPGCV